MPTFAPTKPTNNLKHKIMKTKKTTRANSAKETAKRANNRRSAAAQKPVEVEAIEVESVPAAVPAVKETPKNEKVTSKDVLKAAGTLRAAVKE